MQKYITFIFLYCVALSSYAQNINHKANSDSVNFYVKQSKNEKSDIGSRVNFAEKAQQVALKTKNDSIILSVNRNVAFLYLISENYPLYKETLLKNLRLSEELNDSLALALTNDNLGYYYYLYSVNDSAYYYYYNAAKIFNALGKVKNEGEALLDMADIQESERDYVGSEVNAFAAIELIETLPKTDNNLESLWTLYNLLGIVYGELENYDRAIEFHELALTYSKNLRDRYYYQRLSNNNIGSIYRKKGDYDIALTYFEKLNNEKKLLEEDPKIYVAIITNLAYMKYLTQTADESEIHDLFNTAYKISNDNEDLNSKMTIGQYMSEFFKSNGKMDSALYYANETYKIAKETNSNEILLKSLELKAALEDDNSAKKYLAERIKLSDSLQKKERAIRNKFARINYETDQFKAENKQISRERLWLMLLSGGLILTIILLYIVITQRLKNKELRFYKQQQETNEEIYNLMLSQQDKIEEARISEKRRISEELHDGILGRLFGTRLSLDSLNMSTKEDAIKTRGTYIEELKKIEQDIRVVSHELNVDFISGSGYMDIIKSLVETQTDAFKLKCELTKDNDIQWDLVSNKTKIHFYRIIQESLQNIYKHDKANEVKISFELKNNVICLIINDNGTGFDLNKAKKGIGLKNISSRVKEIKGELHIDSKRNSGTNISIQVPI